MNPPISYLANTSFFDTYTQPNQACVKNAQLNRHWQPHACERVVTELERSFRRWVTTGDQGLFQRLLDTLKLNISQKTRRAYSIDSATEIFVYIPQIIRTVLQSGFALGKHTCEELLGMIIHNDVWAFMTSSRPNQQLLATLCIDLAKHWPASARLEKHYILVRVVETWSGKKLDMRYDTLSAISGALYGEAWPLLYGDELNSELSSAVFIKTLEPQFVFEKGDVTVSPQLFGTLSFTTN